MKVLGIETSGTTGSVAVVGDGNREERPFPHGTAHGRDLAPVLEGLLADLSLGFGDLDGVAVSAGPGSYTGLRIGMAFAKALALAADLPLVGVPTFDAMARRGPKGEGPLAPVLDARWGQVYAALFEPGPGGPVRSTEDRVGPAAEVTADFPAGTRYFGPGAAVYGEVLRARGTVAPPGPWDTVSAAEVAAVGASRLASRGPDDPDALHPIYLRPSQAEARKDETEALG